MIKKMFKNIILIILIVVAGCSGNKEAHETRNRVIESQKIFIEEEVTSNLDTNYLVEIDSINSLEDGYNNLLRYSVNIKLNNSVLNLTDVELQEMIENIPINNFGTYYTWLYEVDRKYYEFEIQSYNIFVGDDLYIYENLPYEPVTLTKNSIEFNPKEAFLAEQREIERNRKYKVMLKVGVQYYLIDKATKTEIIKKYEDVMKNRKSKMSGHSQMGPKNRHLLIPPLDWDKDVEILKVYN